MAVSHGKTSPSTSKRSQSILLAYFPFLLPSSQPFLLSHPTQWHATDLFPCLVSLLAHHSTPIFHLTICLLISPPPLPLVYFTIDSIGVSRHRSIPQLFCHLVPTPFPFLNPLAFPTHALPLLCDPLCQSAYILLFARAFRTLGVYLAQLPPPHFSNPYSSR